MLLLPNRSIKLKLTVVMMAICTIVLLVATIAFLSYELISSRRTMVQDLSTLAKVIGINCSAALLFDDPEAAQETLSALVAEPHIIAAAIYSKTGDVFAGYRADEREKSPVAVESGKAEQLPAKQAARGLDGYEFHTDRLDMLQSIRLDNEIIGTVYLQADLGRLYSRFARYSIICLAIMAVCLAVAFLLAAMLQGMISRPILNLVKTMNIISREKDYGIRVSRESNDEIGRLIDGFNDMLAEIQKRDEALYFTQFCVDQMAEAVFWADSQGRLFYVNEAACRSLDCSRADLLTMHVADLEPQFPIERWPDHWNEVKKRGSFTLQSVHQRSDGEIFPVEITAQHLKFHGIEYLCCFVRDVSERIQLESQLQRAQKMEAIGSLVAGVAHDLNNILSGLVSYPELLLMDLPDGSPLREIVTIIRDSGHKAAAVVQDLLTLARRGVAAKEVLNLNEIISEYLLSPEFQDLCSFHSNVTFETCLDSDLLNVSGSPVQLLKVLINLVSNAAEAIPNGGRVTIETENRYIERPIKGYDEVREGDYVVLRVADTGGGISEQDLKRIFEPFFTKKVMGRSGTGLGMTVVWGSVKDHNGYIDIDSADGRGTSFSVYLPVTREGITPKEHDLSIEDYRGDEKILVIDDIDEQRLIASAMLKKLGYSVATCASGEEAVEYLRKNRANLIVLDMILEGGMDGLETYQQILQVEPGQKAIIASGFSETGRVKQAEQLGAGAYLKKPYTLAKLGLAVRTALDKGK
ncbi:MAG: ATP-binding protein [Desulforhabdus sp.]|jgi:PAS domain S-box-containing protein|nr:ATP-binding protein [Desulforhabdus sp.]